MKVTKKSHPFLFEAFTAIDFDSGRNLAKKNIPTEFEIPERCHEMVGPAERALAAMTEDERETVSIGDQDIAEEIVKAIGSDAEQLNMLLAEHFCDYCAGSNPEGP